MKKIIFIIAAILGLALTIIPSILLFTGSISTETLKRLMLIGFVLWFAGAPVWIGKK